MGRIRTIAPAGGFPSLIELATTVRRYHLAAKKPHRSKSEIGPLSVVADQLSTVLKAFSGGSDILLYGSGTAALYTLLSVLKEQSGKSYLLISAYTCPDVAAAALRAGFKIFLIDLDPESLQLRPQSVPVDIFRGAAGVVLSNLYGLPDLAEPWLQAAKSGEGFFIVDDACQAFQSHDGEERVGSRRGTLGVLSFGRGKSFCGMGGGAIISRHDDSHAFTHKLRAQEFEINRGMQSVKDLYSVLAAWFLENPLLYTFPSSIPALGLGETHCNLNFAVRGISEAQAFVALTQTGAFLQESVERVARAGRYEKILGTRLELSLPSLKRKPPLDAQQREPVLLRFPVVFPDRATRDEHLQLFTRKGLGASGSYPRCLDEYPEFDGSVSFGDISGARSLSGRILSLPLHRYVSETVQTRILDAALWNI